MLSGGGRITTLALDDIYNIESVDRRTFVYTSKDVFRCEQKLYEVESAFGDSGLVLLYGYFVGWFVKANWYLVFAFVAAVYIVAVVLDIVRVKKMWTLLIPHLRRKEGNQKLNELFISRDLEAYTLGATPYIFLKVSVM